MKIIDFHVEELVNMYGIVISTQPTWPNFVKVRIPGGFPNQHLDDEPIWFFSRDELEPAAVSASQARREAVQRDRG